MLPNLLLVGTCRRWPPGGLSHSQAACEPASRGGGGSYSKYEVSCDWRFEPHQCLAKARGTSASRS